MTTLHRLSSLVLSGLLVGASLAAGGCVVAQPAESHAMRNGYNYLGERWVHGGGAEVHEAIAGLRGDGRMTSVMLVVENAPVQMDRVVITFGDGQRQEIPTRIEFGPNSTTREIPLEGGARVIRRVDFVFNNFPGNGQAKVELWGR
jgi:hypothetical protein